MSASRHQGGFLEKTRFREANTGQGFLSAMDQLEQQTTSRVWWTEDTKVPHRGFSKVSNSFSKLLEREIKDEQVLF